MQISLLAIAGTSCEFHIRGLSECGLLAAVNGGHALAMYADRVCTHASTCQAVFAFISFSAFVASARGQQYPVAN